MQVAPWVALRDIDGVLDVGVQGQHGRVRWSPPLALR